MTPEMNKTQLDLASKVRRQQDAVNGTEAFIRELAEEPFFADAVARARNKLAKQQRTLEQSKALLAKYNELQTKHAKKPSK